MGLVTSEIGLRLVELRLKGARIELGQELAFFDKLAILEVDADDRFCDHAADRRRVERRNVSDPGQHDREIALLNCRRDDRNGRSGLWHRGGRVVREVPPDQVTPGDGDKYAKTNEQLPTPSESPTGFSRGCRCDSRV